jgi:hypothetical protein
MTNKIDILDAIRRTAQTLGHSPSRAEFMATSGMSEYQILQHFPGWREAVRIAGLEPDASNVRLEDPILLEDWGTMVRKHRQIPTRANYGRKGKYSPGSFEKHFGPWSAIPAKFVAFANGKQDWLDVVALLPVNPEKLVLEAYPTASDDSAVQREPVRDVSRIQHSRLDSRLTYGNPIDFRGLRHEPVNEGGVVFLFGMVAKELGYLVESVQAGFPDCEAKRQVAAGRWQRVRIEFEFESRNFRDHGHPQDGCDVIVCWRHNWADCPDNLEVIQLCTIIKSLAKSED